MQPLEKVEKKSEADQERESAAEALGPNALQSAHVDVKPDATFRLARIRTELDTTALRLDIAASGSASNSAPSGAAIESAASHIRRGRLELPPAPLDSSQNELRLLVRTAPAHAAPHRAL